LDLSRTHLRSLRWNSVSTLLIALGQVALLLFLVNLVPSAEFGRFALLQSWNAFIIIFLDLGLSNAIIVDKDLKSTHVHTFARFFVFSGLLFALLTCLLSIWYAQYTSLLWMVALYTFFLALGLLPKALLRRHHRFDRLASVECISFFTGAALTIGLARVGWGAEAMMMGLLCIAALSSLLCLWSEPAGWSTRVPGTGEGQTHGTWNRLVAWGMHDLHFVREKMQFGAFQVGDRLVALLHSRADTLLVGAVLGVELLGVYDVAKQLFARFSGAISSALGPVYLSSLQQVASDKTTLREAYHGLLHGVAMLSFPVLLLAMLLTEHLCTLVLGTAWSGAVFLVRCLAFCYFIRSTAMFALLPSLIQGNSRPGLYWNSVHAAVALPLLAGGMYFGGLDGVGISLVVVQVLLFYPSYLYLLQPYLSGSFVAYLRVFLPALAPALVAVSACAIGLHFLPEVTWKNLILLAILAVFTYGIAVFSMFSRVFPQFKV
jgi:lipopolysaccharide exporter